MPALVNFTLADWYLQAKLNTTVKGTPFSYPLNSSNMVMRLYTNDYTPTPASVPASFTEAAWDTYATVSLNSMFGDVQQQQVGTWSSISQLFSFSQPHAGGPYTVWGWYVTVSINNIENMVMAARFTSAYTITTSSNSLDIRINMQEWDSSTLQQQAC